MLSKASTALSSDAEAKGPQHTMRLEDTNRQSQGSRDLIEMSQISKTFGGVRALRNVSFSVRPGEIHCLAGENGSGKSTLIKIIAGVHAPDPGGHFAFDDTTCNSLSPQRARELGVEVIWQDLALFPEMSVAENIAFADNLGLWPRPTNHKAVRQKAQASLQRLGVSLDLETPLRQFPISVRQIVAIARSLLGEARVVFMDEPTASLTNQETKRLIEVVHRLASDGIAVVFVSHRLAEVLEIAERVTVLRDGQLVGVYPASEMTQSRLSELMTGKTFDDTVAASDKTGAPVALEVSDLCRGGEFKNISFRLHRGEILGLTGLLGAGRTELAMSLFGLHQPDSGHIVLDGRKVQFSNNRNAIEAGIAYVSEDRLALGLIQAQSIADNISIPIYRRLLNFVGLLRRDQKRTEVQDWIDRLAIKVGQPTDAVSTLSGGNQQRVVLAKWLATAPKVLILDSPTVGVDIGARAGIFVLVRELADAGMAILLISDEIPEVYFNADRILHMADGEIRGEYDPKQSSIETLEATVHG